MATVLLEKETERLAVGVVYLLYKRATTNFPSSTRAHPSYLVYVQRSATSELRPGDRAYFPFQVTWFIWEECIVPVLSALWSRNLGDIGNYDEQIAYVSGLIKTSLVHKGYYPSSSAYDSYNIEDLVDESGQNNPGLYGNMNWLRLHFELPEDKLPE